MEQTKVKYKFKEGEEVAHVDNLVQKMNIEKLVKSSKQVEDGETMKMISYIQGIRCHWWDKNGNFQVNIFHSKELVPYDVAQDGFIAVEKWISTNR